LEYRLEEKGKFDQHAMFQIHRLWSRIKDFVTDKMEEERAVISGFFKTIHLHGAGCVEGAHEIVAFDDGRPARVPPSSTYGR